MWSSGFELQSEWCQGCAATIINASTIGQKVNSKTLALRLAVLVKRI